MQSNSIQIMSVTSYFKSREPAEARGKFPLPTPALSNPLQPPPDPSLLLYLFATSVPVINHTLIIMLCFEHPEHGEIRLVTTTDQLCQITKYICFCVFKLFDLFISFSCFIICPLYLAHLADQGYCNACNTHHIVAR